MTPQPTIRLGLAWWEALLVLVAYAIPAALYGAHGTALLTAIAAGIAFGVWRCVRILGQLLELKQAEIFDDER